MKVRCPNCKEIFRQTMVRKNQLENAIKKNQRLLMIECSECYKDVPINPMDLMSYEPQKDKPTKDEFDSKNCPICKDGIISFIDNEEEKFWGCGNCGNVWQSRNDLMKELKK